MRGSLGLQVIEQVEPGRHGNRRERLIAGVVGKAAALTVEGICDHAPGSEGGGLTGEAGLLVEPLEDGDVGIGHGIVRVDARVGVAGQGFAVAGIGEVEAVGDVRVGAFVAVAVDLAFGNDVAPEKRHQRGPRLLRTSNGHTAAPRHRQADCRCWPWSAATGSAPRKTSCQRRPSVMIRKTCSCAGSAAERLTALASGWPLRTRREDSKSEKLFRADFHAAMLFQLSLE